MIKSYIPPAGQAERSSYEKDSECGTVKDNCVDLHADGPFGSMLCRAFAGMGIQCYARCRKTCISNILLYAERLLDELIDFGENLIVEGFEKTSSRLKYCLRLLVFALISEVPYDMLMHRAWFYPYGNNIMFTLMLTVLVLWIVDVLQKKGTPGIIAALSIAIAAGVAAYFLHLEYSWKCIAIAMLFYVAKNDDAVKYAGTACILLINTTITGLNAVFALPLIYLYNGKKGKTQKYFFYIFYPVHILALGIVKCFLI